MSSVSKSLTLSLQLSQAASTPLGMADGIGLRSRKGGVTVLVRKPLGVSVLESMSSPQFQLRKPLRPLSPDFNNQAPCSWVGYLDCNHEHDIEEALVPGSGILACGRGLLIPVLKRATSPAGTGQRQKSGN